MTKEGITVNGFCLPNIDTGKYGLGDYEAALKALNGSLRWRFDDIIKTLDSVWLNDITPLIADYYGVNQYALFYQWVESGGKEKLACRIDYRIP
jgi:hypothetical protein